MRPLIEKNQELIKEIEDFRRKYPESGAKKWTQAKTDAAETTSYGLSEEIPQVKTTLPILPAKPMDVYAKEISLLRKENEKLHLELASRPSAREWKMAQHRIKDLEGEILSKEKLGSSQRKCY